MEEINNKNRKRNKHHSPACNFKIKCFHKLTFVFILSHVDGVRG